MAQTITVVYENGVLYPTIPLPLKERQSIQIQIMSEENEPLLLKHPPHKRRFDKEIEREKAAYIQMHPTLKEHNLGQSVAIYRGELIDTDSDYDDLYERVREKYPDEFVWFAVVKDVPIETISMRSPRLSPASASN